MLKIKLVTLTILVIALPSAHSEVKKTTTHTHNGRSHTHVLPTREGVNHSHGSKSTQQKKHNKIHRINKVYVDNAPTTKCDLLAANPDDSQKKIRGVRFNYIDIAAAKNACKNAIQKYPNNGRFQYQYGRVLEKEKQDKDAVTWYKKAASNGHRMANYNLGMLYNRYNQKLNAIKYLTVAANHGDTYSMYQIGQIYETKIKDYQQAEKWYKAAARKGNVDAMWQLKSLYSNGGSSSCNGRTSSDINDPCYSASKRGYMKTLPGSGF